MKRFAEFGYHRLLNDRKINNVVRWWIVMTIKLRIGVDVYSTINITILTYMR